MRESRARLARDRRSMGRLTIFGLTGVQDCWPWHTPSPAEYARSSGLRRSCTSHFFHADGLEFHTQYSEDGCVTMNRGGAKGRMPMVSDRRVSAGRPCIYAISRKLDFLDRLYAD